ncbi:threonylcarbamoyl-AMP synthase [candidate division KSB1 bacterium]|nr:threonylcarbamoyl-AMP synthase [candidate division KSB1 bacterium]
MLLTINPDNPQLRLIRQAVTILQNGGVIAYPTDTIYGIGCDVFNKKAIERIYIIKQKSRKEPLSFICPDLKDVSKYAVVSNADYKIMRHFFPGPYTFVLRGTRLVPQLMLTKRKSVGIRVPDNKICLMLLQEFGNPIVSTSVNTVINEIVNDPYEIEQRLGNTLDLVIDGGVMGFDSSSVIDLTTEPPTVLRVGKGDVSYFQ